MYSGIALCLYHQLPSAGYPVYKINQDINNKCYHFRKYLITNTTI